jgi:AICAR transformylase/IMP cyclohydrolase PurH
MANLTDVLRGQLSSELLTSLQSMIDLGQYNAGTELVTSGAISVAVRHSDISVTGTVAYTLEDGTYEGQIKTLNCTVAATVPDGTVTPNLFDNAATITLDAVDESISLVWHTAAGWRIAQIAGATIT